MEMPGWYDIVRQRVRLLVLSGSISMTFINRPIADRHFRQRLATLLKLTTSELSVPIIPALILLLSWIARLVGAAGDSWEGTILGTNS